MAESYTFQGTPSFILAQKHRALKKDLKWKREMGDVGHKKETAKEIIAELEPQEENNWNIIPKMQNFIIWKNPKNFILIHILGIKM